VSTYTEAARELKRANKLEAVELWVFGGRHGTGGATIGSPAFSRLAPQRVRELATVLRASLPELATLPHNEIAELVRAKLEAEAIVLFTLDPPFVGQEHRARPGVSVESKVLPYFPTALEAAARRMDRQRGGLDSGAGAAS